MRSKLTNRYLHHYHTPIVVKVFDVDEHWYYNPEFNPAWLPVPSSGDPFIRAIFDLSQWYSTNEDGWFNGGKP